MITVYRFEDTNRKGPYSHHMLTPMVQNHCNDLEGHPGGFECNPLPTYSFGFASISQAIDWFHQFIPDLINWGHSLKKYETDDFRTGPSGKQLIFRTETAILVGEVKLGLDFYPRIDILEP